MHREIMNKYVGQNNE